MARKAEGLEPLLEYASKAEKPTGEQSHISLVTSILTRVVLTVPLGRMMESKHNLVDSRLSTQSTLLITV